MKSNIRILAVLAASASICSYSAFALSVDQAKAISSSIKGSKTIEVAAQEASASVKTAIGLKRNQQTPEFDGPAIATAYSVGDQAFVTSPGGDGKTARVMQVVKVALPSVMATSPELEQIKQQMKSAFENDLRTGLISSLKKQVAIKINAALWKQNTGSDAPSEE